MPNNSNLGDCMSKCPKCGKVSCGDDSHTKSTIKKERNIGDRNKIVLQIFYDYVELDNLQKHEVFGMLNALWDEHILETEE